jgi:glycopeptide antibiotics resistance protein
MDNESFTLGVQVSRSLIREVQRSILMVGMMIIFGIACLQYTAQGHFDQILPFFTGLMGMIIGHFFARRGRSNADKDNTQ